MNRRVQLANQIDQVLDAAAKSVQFPNDEGIALAQHFQHIGQCGPLGATAADLVFEDLLAACVVQCFYLKIKVLILRRDTRIRISPGTAARPYLPPVKQP